MNRHLGSNAGIGSALLVMCGSAILYFTFCRGPKRLRRPKVLVERVGGKSTCWCSSAHFLKRQPVTLCTLSCSFAVLAGVSKKRLPKKSAYRDVELGTRYGARGGDARFLPCMWNEETDA